jgi:hypothetical protein
VAATTFPHPRLRHRPRRNLRRLRSTTSGGYKRSTPTWSTPLFFLLRPLHPPYATLLTVAKPLWTTTLAPSPTSSIPPQAPHQCHEPPRPPCWRPRLLPRATTITPRRTDCTVVELPALVSTSSSSTPYRVHHRSGLLPGHSTVDHWPPASRILLASCRRRWGEELPCFSVVDQKATWARLLCRARPSASVDPSPLLQWPFSFTL